MTGAQEDFICVYNDVEPWLRGVVRRRLWRHPELLPDVMQETFLRMIRCRAQFVNGRNVRAWACTIAINHITDTYGETDLPVRQVDLIARGGFQVPPDLAAEINEILAETLNTMRADYANAFWLIRVDGLSHAAAADQLGVPVNTASIWLHRALELLAKALQDYLEHR